MALAITKSLIGQKDGSAIACNYDNLDEADTSPSVIELPEYESASVQVIGTFGTGGTVVVQGSNDGSTWVTLNDSSGAAISLTAAGLKQIKTPTRFIRPLVSAGTGVDVDVFFVFSRTSGMRT